VLGIRMNESTYPTLRSGRGACPRRRFTRSSKMEWRRNMTLPMKRTLSLALAVILGCGKAVIAFARPLTETTRPNATCTSALSRFTSTRKTGSPKRHA
jgi:hypothetical protein